MTALYGYKDKTTDKRIIALALRNKDAVLLAIPMIIVTLCRPRWALAGRLSLRFLSRLDRGLSLDIRNGLSVR